MQQAQVLKGQVVTSTRGERSNETVSLTGGIQLFDLKGRCGSMRVGCGLYPTGPGEQLPPEVEGRGCGVAKFGKKTMLITCNGITTLLSDKSSGAVPKQHKPIFCGSRR